MPKDIAPKGIPLKDITPKGDITPHSCGDGKYCPKIMKLNNIQRRQSGSATATHL